MEFTIDNTILTKKDYLILQDIPPALFLLCKLRLDYKYEIPFLFIDKEFADEYYWSLEDVTSAKEMLIYEDFLKQDDKFIKNLHHYILTLPKT